MNLPPGVEVPDLHTPLKKKSPGSTFMTVWQKRYYVLYSEKGCINCYKAEKDWMSLEEPYVVIPTDRIEKVLEYKDDSKPCRFNLHLEGGRVFQLTANSGAEADAWIYNINACIQNRARVRLLSPEVAQSAYWKPEIGYKALTVLQNTPFADRTKPSQLRAFASYFDTKLYTAGETMFQLADLSEESDEKANSGNTTSAFFILESGKVELKADGVHLCYKQAGDFVPLFESEDLIDFNIKIVAMENTTTYRLTAGELDSFLDDNEDTDTSNIRTLVGLNMIQLLRVMPLFSMLPDRNLYIVQCLLRYSRVEANSYLFREGDAGDSMYVFHTRTHSHTHIDG